MYKHKFAREVFSQNPRESIKYSVCTLVTRPVDYETMVSSMLEKGFGLDDCEYLYVDNTKPSQTDAYLAIRTMISSSKGKYVIVCHQDVVYSEDGRLELDYLLEALTEKDPHWAVCGNAGAFGPGPTHLVCRITDPHGRNQKIGSFPGRVMSLDENLLIIRREANVLISRDLSGFHLYGTDICLLSDIAGYSNYVIDFHLEHKSAGRLDEFFAEANRNFSLNYRRKLRNRWIHTTCTSIFVTSSNLYQSIFNSSLSRRSVRRLGIMLPQISRVLFGSRN